jgi:fucose permease
VTPDVAPTTQARTVTGPVVLYWCAFLVIGLSLSFLGPALSELRETVGVDIGSIGVLFVGLSLGYVAGSFIGGRLYDRFVGHRVFSTSLFVVAAGVAAVPVLSSLGTLFAAFVLVGVGAAIGDVGANTMLMWETGSEGGRAMNVLHLCFGIGALAAPLLVHLGLGVATGVCAVGCVLLGGAALAVRSPRQRVATDDREQSPPPRLLALLSAFFCFYVGLEVGFAGWIPTYGEEIDLSDLAVTWLTATFWIGFTSGRLLASAIAHRFRPKLVLAAACTLTVVAAVVLVVGDGRAGPIWFGTALFGLAAAPQFPVMLSYLERRLHITGSATSWFVGAAGIGGLAFPWLIGQSIDAWGASALVWSVLVLSLTTAASLLVSDRRPVRRRDEGRGACPGPRPW